MRSAGFYEPDLNRTYLDLARHYGTTAIPTRVAKPRDKAKTETAVQIVERSVLAPLRNQTFFSLAELNALQLLKGPIGQLLAQQCDGRYHVEVSRHCYSVPHALACEAVEVRLSSTAVEIFHSGRRVASCAQSPGRRLHHDPGAPAEGAPEALGVESFAPDPVGRDHLCLHGSAGPPDPGEQASPGAGLPRLPRSHAAGKALLAERLEAACFRALRSGAHSYRSVKSILGHGLDRVPLEEQAELTLPTDHENVRGAANYQS